MSRKAKKKTTTWSKKCVKDSTTKEEFMEKVWPVNCITTKPTSLSEESSKLTEIGIRKEPLITNTPINATQWLAYQTLSNPEEMTEFITDRNPAASHDTHYQVRWTCSECRKAGVIWVKKTEKLKLCPTCKKELTLRTILPPEGRYEDMWRSPMSGLKLKSIGEHCEEWASREESDENPQEGEW